MKIVCSEDSYLEVFLKFLLRSIKCLRLLLISDCMYELSANSLILAKK